MKWTKKNVRAILCAIIVAFVGYELQIVIMKALGMETHRPDIIRRIGRNGPRNPFGRRDTGLSFDDDELDINFDV